MASRLPSCLRDLRFSLHLAAVSFLATQLYAADVALPAIVRVFPLGGTAGSSVTLELSGERLSNTRSVQFDCNDLRWTKTLDSSSGKVVGLVSISRDASLGPHMLHAVTDDGPSNSAIFNVGQFPSVLEREPNDRTAEAQFLDTGPLEVQGKLDGAADIDQFAIRVRKGERKVFDLRAIEHGSAVEARMYLLDERGAQVAFNDDRSDIDENPLIEHTFDRDGVYRIKLDQYRGPRGFNFGKNCTYILRISSLPGIRYIAPLGLRRGRAGRLQISGTGVEALNRVYLTPLRAAEYARMTYPYTMPVRFAPDPPDAAAVARINGTVVRRNHGEVAVEFMVPDDAEVGLWRIWVASREGVADGPPLEISDGPELTEAEARNSPLQVRPFAINGSLAAEGEKDTFRIEGRAGQPMHFWTLAAQLGVPALDTILQLRDASGKKLAEGDDVVAGQGTLIGNPDSSLFYTPVVDGPLFLTVADRLKRGGPDLQYRLKVSGDRPSFQLFTTPENFTVQQGGTAQIKVHLVRDAGFEGEVPVWFEGMPDGVEALRGKFRADQLFEPNADGADMIIPEISFLIHVPESVPPGTYEFRVFGAAAGHESGPNRHVVEAHRTMLMGPLLDLWNFVRRPLAGISLTVVAPFDSRVLISDRNVSLSPGDTAKLDLQTKHIPAEATFVLKGLPRDVTYEVGQRSPEQVAVLLKAGPKANKGTSEISVEANIGNRWVPSDIISLQIEKRP
jgi:hypothetical protein